MTTKLNKRAGCLSRTFRPGLVAVFIGVPHGVRFAR
jgi:hypothetical protein